MDEEVTMRPLGRQLFHNLMIKTFSIVPKTTMILRRPNGQASISFKWPQIILEKNLNENSHRNRKNVFEFSLKFPEIFFNRHQKLCSKIAIFTLYTPEIIHHKASSLRNRSVFYVEMRSNKAILENLQNLHNLSHEEYNCKCFYYYRMLARMKPGYYCLCVFCVRSENHKFISHWFSQPHISKQKAVPVKWHSWVQNMHKCLILFSFYFTSTDCSIALFFAIFSSFPPSSIQYCPSRCPSFIHRCFVLRTISHV